MVKINSDLSIFLNGCIRNNTIVMIYMPIKQNNDHGLQINIEPMIRFK